MKVSLLLGTFAGGWAFFLSRLGGAPSLDSLNVAGLVGCAWVFIGQWYAITHPAPLAHTPNIFASEHRTRAYRMVVELKMSNTTTRILRFPPEVTTAHLARYYHQIVRMGLPPTERNSGVPRGAHNAIRDTLLAAGLAAWRVDGAVTQGYYLHASGKHVLRKVVNVESNDE